MGASLNTIVEWMLGIILLLSSIGVISANKPVYSSLSFLVTLLALAGLYLELSAPFISVMQILVYAGAILVIFMFVIVLFQDAYQQLAENQPQSSRSLLFLAAGTFVVTMMLLYAAFLGITPTKTAIPLEFGTVQALGKELYIHYFFPFEALVVLFLIALVGALYVGRKEV